MPREALPSLNERAFVLQALSQNVRIDGRALDRIRQPEIRFGAGYGDVEVRMGKTRVQAKTSVEPSAPYTDRKFDGIFTIVAELSPMASPAFESGRPNEIEPLLTRSLEKSLRRSAAVDTESLCLVAGRLCFALTLTLHVLSLDGALFDATLCAATTALAHARIPATHVAGQDVRIFTEDERVPVPLSLHHKPYCITWAYFADPNGETSGASKAGGAPKLSGGSRSEGAGSAGQAVWVADPTQLEAQCASATLVVTANREGEVVQVAKMGGAAADAVALLDRVEKSVKVARDVHRVVEEALQKDRERREGGKEGEKEARAENER